VQQFPGRSSALQRLLIAPSSPHLKEYVRTYAQRDVAFSESPIVQPVPATLENVIEFEFLGMPIVEYVDEEPFSSYRTALIGAQTSRRANVRFNCDIESFGIFFEPFGLWQLFGIPTGELVNQGFAAEDVLGKPIRDLWEQLAEIRSFQHRVDTVEQFLSAMLVRVSDRTRLMDSAHYLIYGQPTNRVSEIARATGLSVRQYERRFIADIGVSPKLYARIIRYQGALDRKLRRPERSWLSIAHEAGYYDQTHMIKDFELLTGASPERLLAGLGDGRPTPRDLVDRADIARKSA